MQYYLGVVFVSYLDDELGLWADDMLSVHLPRWHELPDFDLYMDQVVTIVNHELSFLQAGEEDTILTPAMVNNYVKLKLMPKPVKKRYTRVHLAYLIIIVLLKPVLSISDIRYGIVLQVSAFKGRHQPAYDLYCKQQEKCLHAIAHIAKGQPVEHHLLDSLPMYMRGIYMATYSLASKLFAEKFLMIERKQRMMVSDQGNHIPSEH